MDHLNKADSLFVNASTWGLLLAGKVVSTPNEWSKNPNNFLSGLISKSGETIETLSQFFFLKNKMKEINNFKKKVFIITENKKSTLKEIQEEEGFKFYEHKK